MPGPNIDRATPKVLATLGRAGFEGRLGALRSRVVESLDIGRRWRTVTAVGSASVKSETAALAALTEPRPWGLVASPGAVPDDPATATATHGNER